MLISAVQQNDSLYIHMCVCVCICFHIHFHYGLSQDIECSSPCFTEGPYCLSIAYTLDASANPKLPIYPPLLHDHISVLYFSETVSVLWIGSFVSYKWYHVVFISVWLTSLSKIILKALHVAAIGITSFFVMVEQHTIVYMDHIKILFNELHFKYELTAKDQETFDRSI